MYFLMSLVAGSRKAMGLNSFFFSIDDEILGKFLVLSSVPLTNAINLRKAAPLDSFYIFENIVTSLP